MVCSVALDINNGKMPRPASVYGAKIISRMSSSQTKANMDPITKLPTKKEIAEASNFDRGASYIFSNIKETTPQGLSNVVDINDEKTLKKLEASGANLYKGMANDFFGTRPHKVLNPITNDGNQLIIEGDFDGKVLDSVDRGFVRITAADVEIFKMTTSIEVDALPERKDGQFNTMDKKKLYDEGLEFLLISALYRGYNVVIDSTIDSEVVAKALKRYNTHLNSNNAKTHFVSSVRFGEGIIKTNDLQGFVEGLTYKHSTKPPRANTSSLFLNTFLTEGERKRFKVYKKADRASKAMVTRRLAKAFTKLVKGVDVQVMDNADILENYGDTFTRKKGFIIGNKIILNSDLMSPDTVFHEFGHFYMQWLEENDTTAYRAMLDNVRNEFESSIPSYTSTYNSTGLEFSEEDILTEIFVDKIGMMAASKLELEIEGGTVDINETIDAYVEKFVRILTRDNLVNANAIGFGLDTSITKMFNIAYAAKQINKVSTLFTNKDGENFDRLRNFFMPEPDAKELFNSLIIRGLVKRIDANTIILTDTKGNRYNEKGEIDPKATFKYHDKWDSVANVRANEKFLAAASGYLNRFKNEAKVFFSAVTPKAQSVVDTIRNGSRGVELNEDGDRYIIKHEPGVTFRRTTEYLSKTFGSGAESESYVYSKIWSDKINEEREAIAKMFPDRPLQEVDELAIQRTQDYMQPGNEPFEEHKADIERIFEFKTSEGTFLHNLGEFYFRSLNYIYDLYAKDEGKSYVHYAEILRKKIASDDITKFMAYIDGYVVNKIQDQAGTPEYEAFIDSYVFLKENLANRNASNIKDFVKLLDTKVVPILNRLPGPLTIMPEVQLASKSMKVAGKLDLLVVDATGRAHIFDYKTKERNKRFYWDYISSVNMQGALSDYPDNAMMKASIQTSIYKLILMEMGIEVAPSNVFYVESTIPESEAGGYDSETSMEYEPTDILKKGLHDVTAELANHFKTEEGVDMSFTESTEMSSDLQEVIFKASGNRNLEVPDNVEALARKYYERAINKANPKDAVNKGLEDFLRSKNLQSLGGKGGLTITLKGNTRYTLTSGLTEDQAIAEIVEVLKDRKDIKNVTTEIIDMFNSPEKEGGIGNDRHAIYRGLLSGAEPNGYEITKLSSTADYGLESAGILFLKNKVTKRTRVIVLNHDEESSINFGNDRKNIYGNFISDLGASMLVPRGAWRATNYNMRLIKMGLIMAQQKLLDPDFSLEVIVSNNSFSERTVPNLHDVNEILLASKNMLTAMQEAGETIPPAMQELLDNPRVFEANNYQENPIRALSEFLHMSTGSLIRSHDLFNRGTKGDKRLQHLKNLISQDVTSDRIQQVLVALRNFRHSLSSTKSLSNLDAKLSSDLWALTDQSIMFLHGFNDLISPKNTNMYDKFLSTPGRTSNMHQAYYNKKITEGTINIREDFIEYKKEHAKLIEDLAKSKGITLGRIGSALYTSSRKKIFENLYAYDNNGERKDAFKLRNPNYPNKITKSGQTRLNKAEIAYLRYFRKTSQHFAEVGTVTVQPDIPYGWMPLMRKSNLSRRADLNPFDRARETWENVKEGLSPSGSVKKDKKTVEEEFTLESRFEGQIPKDSSIENENYTMSRRRWLGVDPTGEEVDPHARLDLIEDNLENVLDSFAMASLDAHHYREISELGKAMFYSIKRHEKLSGGTTYDHLIETLALMQKRVVKHEKSGNNVIMGAMDKLATSVVTAGTVNQALLETFTNPAITASTYLSDKIYGLMFKGDRKFSMKNFSKASSMVWMNTGKTRALIDAIDNMYGMSNMDTANLKKVLNELEANSLFQTENLMFWNKMMLENWQKITMVAYMLEQGSFYAHSLNADGELEYDETKDKRFYNYSGDAEDQIDRNKVYEATKDELAKQRNGLTGTIEDAYKDRKLKRAWTNYDVNNLKTILVEAYSSMDEASKSLASYYTFTGALFKMRVWITARLPRYFQKPMTAAENFGAAKLIKEDDPTAPLQYRYVWKGTETEGILYTIHYLAKMITEYGFNFQRYKFRSEVQRENLSKLLGDMIVSGVTMAAAYGIFAGLGDELIRDRMLMAASDVFLPKALLDVTTQQGSLYISGAIAVRASKAFIDTVFVGGAAIYNPDVTMTDVYGSVNHLLNSTVGVTKTLDAVVDQFIEQPTN